MTINTPEWLARHGGELRRDADSRTWLVIFNGGPQYKLTATPAAGRYTCTIVQTVNSRRIDKGTATYATAEDAVRGGLEELRNHLGW